MKYSVRFFAPFGSLAVSLLLGFPSFAQPTDPAPPAASESAAAEATDEEAEAPTPSSEDAVSTEESETSEEDADGVADEPVPAESIEESSSKPISEAAGEPTHPQFPPERLNDLPTEVGSADVENAPPPDKASNVSVEPKKRGRGAVWIPRALLFIPRYILEIPFYTIRGLVYAYKKYQLDDWYFRIFYNESRTFGIVPNLSFATGFGSTYGASLVWKDIFGHGEQLNFSGMYGDSGRQRYGGVIRSGKLFGDRVAVRLDASYQRRSNQRFIGIGNGGDRTTDPPPSGLVAPVGDYQAIDTRYRENVIKAGLTINTTLIKYTSIRLRSLYRRSRFGDVRNTRDRLRTGDVYDTTLLPAFERGFSTIYNEAGLIFNTRRPVSRYISKGIANPGVRLEAFGGHVAGVIDDFDSRYWRWGFDLGGTVSLFHGDRNLSLRLYADSVTGDLEQVPFVVMPTIGGWTFLRGFQMDRFRDLAMTLASVEYIYPMTRMVSGFLFVDSGRVWRSLKNFRFDGFRWGYGGGIQFHSLDGLIGRFMLSGSKEGFFVRMVFNQPMESSVRD